MYARDDTIVAVSTPRGCGALGIVRLSGPGALGVAARVFRPLRVSSLSSVPTHSSHVGHIFDGDDLLDEAVVAVFRAPATVTGEDIAEITAHGNPLILARIVELCCAQGARPAREGEFTFRAFMNAKIDLSRAEAVADIINARSTGAVKSAFRQLEGSLSRRTGEWKIRLVRLASAFEAALDHGEEDISFITPGQAREELRSLRVDIASLKATAEKGRYLRHGIHVSIVGKPNAGKSSLMNTLLERERAIVSDIPGTTRDILEETVEIGGYPFVITDTAGLRRHTDDPVERIGLERSADAMKSADIVLWLIDSSCPVNEEDRHIARLLASHGLISKTLPVLNKCDLPRVAAEQEIAALGFNTAPVPLSALKAAGLKDLERTLCSRVAAAENDSSIFISARHGDILSRADKALAETDAALVRGDTEEIAAFHLRAALDALNEITGENAAEDILASIFSRFCVGK